MRLTALFLAASSSLATVHADIAAIQASKDNTIYQENQANTNGGGQSFFAGPNGIGFQFKGLIAFDLAAAIPAGSTINSVQLTLNVTMTQSGPLNVDLRRALQNWGEGTAVGAGAGGGFGAPATANGTEATWSHAFYNTVPWTTLGGDHAATASSTVSVGGLGAYTWPSTATFVADTQSYLDTPATNYGWFVVLPLGGPAKRFASRENVTASLRPVLTVDYTPPNPFPPFCFGDGSGTACPCGNAGVAGSGCATSSHPGGGTLGATGTASLAADTFVLQGSNMSSVGGVLYFQGDAQQAAGAGIPFGDGLLCIGGQIVRLGIKINSGGASQFPEAGDPLISVQGVVPGPGSVRHYQGWFRDSAAFCTPATFNLTNGITATWGP